MGHGDRSRSPVADSSPTDESTRSGGGGITASSVGKGTMVPVSEPLKFPVAQTGGGSSSMPITQPDFDAMFARSLQTHQDQFVSAVQAPIETIVRDVSKQAYQAMDERMAKVESGVDRVEMAQLQAARDLQDFKKEVLAKLDARAESQNASSALPMSGESNGPSGGTPYSH